MNALIRMKVVQKSVIALGFAFALFSMLGFVQTASAHQDPLSCSANGVTISFALFRNDGVTTISGGDVVTEGETIKYRTTLSFAGEPNCNFSAGTLTITTPDGAVDDVSGGPIPLVSAGNPFVSEFATYVVDASDVGVDGDIDASTNYSNGESHTGTIHDSASATANKQTPFVAALVVEKTANGTFDREWTWGIEKSADQTTLDLEADETATVNYEVELTATPEDTNHEVSGTITITNPDGNPTATINALSDIDDTLNTGEIMVVDCGLTSFPVELEENESLECTYSGASDDDSASNTVTVTTTGNVPGNSDSADIVWSTDPADEVDECVTVNDTNSNFPGNTEVCADDEDKTIEYSVDFGPDGADVVVECGEGSHPNTADFITNDTQTTGDDDASVDWTVTCDVSCTLTQGYWKTHNDLFKGGAASDETWELLSSGEETIFFLSGKSWFEVFNTAPKGNAYYNLAHQYMAAYLNTLTGASVTSEVQDALDDAETFFSANAPTATISKTVKAQLTSLAGTLGAYNEGEIGPGHCE
jgi:hypothetical protein